MIRAFSHATDPFALDSKKLSATIEACHNCTGGVHDAPCLADRPADKLHGRPNCRTLGVTGSLAGQTWPSRLEAQF